MGVGQGCPFAIPLFRDSSDMIQQINLMSCSVKGVEILILISMGGSPGELREEFVTQEKRKKG